MGLKLFEDSKQERSDGKKMAHFLLRFKVMFELSELAWNAKGNQSGLRYH